MNTVAEAVKHYLTVGQRDEELQFPKGSDEHQAAAESVELFVLRFQDILDISEEDNTMPDTTGAVLAALVDIQVRDYALGIMAKNTPQQNISVFSYLVENATEDTKAAPLALLSVAEYESGQTDAAFINAKEADSSLGNLLMRVYTANWPVSAFARMRDELHPKVAADIFGNKE